MLEKKYSPGGQMAEGKNDLGGKKWKEKKCRGKYGVGKVSYNHNLA